jgi:hydroxymethylbilane synthase
LQSGLVAQELQRKHPGLKVETVLIKTSGDQIQDRPLHDFGGKGLFTKELQFALLRGEIDFAVHSYKDVPVTMPLVDTTGLVIVATPPREDPRDVLVSLKSKSVVDLPSGARVGTGSLRRQAQLWALRPDLEILPIRGNVDTRLRKLRDGEFDAIILALAGLKRANLFDASAMSPLDLQVFLPAAGQGALALECRKDDARTAELLGALHDSATAACVDLERALVQKLEGNCHSPIAALATISGHAISLRGAVAKRDGKPPILTAAASAPLAHAAGALDEVFAKLAAQGAMHHLHLGE